MRTRDEAGVAEGGGLKASPGFGRPLYRADLAWLSPAVAARARGCLVVLRKGIKKGRGALCVWGCAAGFRASDSSSQAWTPGRGPPRRGRLGGQGQERSALGEGGTVRPSRPPARGVGPGLLSGGSLSGLRCQCHVKGSLLKMC